MTISFPVFNSHFSVRVCRNHVATVYESMRHLKAGYGAVASSEHAHQSRLELWVLFEEILHAI